METRVALYISYQNHTSTRDTKAIVWSYSVEKMFLKIFQNSQENICAGASF